LRLQSRSCFDLPKFSGVAVGAASWPALENLMSRIPLVEVADLTPAQAEAHKGPSGKLNLFRLLAHAKTLQPGIGQAVQAMMTDVTIEPMDRELCILAVLHLDRGRYEWAQHLQVADAMGLPKAKVEAIADDRFGDPVFEPREKALLTFTRQVVKTVRVDDFVFQAMASFYGPRQIVELVHIIGIYMMFVRVSEVAELEIDNVLGGAVWKAAADKASAS